MLNNVALTNSNWIWNHYDYREVSKSGFSFNVGGQAKQSEYTTFDILSDSSYGSELQNTGEDTQDHFPWYLALKVNPKEPIALKPNLTVPSIKPAVR